MKNKIIIILIFLCIINIIFLIFFWQKKENRKQEIILETPDMEKNVSVGNLKETNIENWSIIDTGIKGYKIGIKDSIIIKDDNADIYFYNDEENTVWLKLRIMNEQNDNILFETGLIKPGQYIQAINMPDINQDTRVKLKIMSYEPETYYSHGAVILNTILKIGG